MRPRPCLLLCLWMGACAAKPATEEGASSSESAPDEWGKDSIEESGSEQDTQMSTEQGEDPEGRPCISLFQDCGQGYKCVPYWLPQDLTGPPTDYKCVAVEGEARAGEACSIADLGSGLDDCDQGSFCWTWVGALAGRCQALCTGGFQYADCIEGWSCALPDDAPPMCVERCDPFADACPSASQCALSSYGATCVSANQDEALALGQACEQLNDCAAGLHCLEAGALLDCADERCCASLCSTSEGNAPCEAVHPSYACLPWLDDPGATTGYCGLAG